jgi:hypothetical protein
VSVDDLDLAEVMGLAGGVEEVCAEAGVPAHRLRRWLRGVHRPDAWALVRVQQALVARGVGVTLEQMMGALERGIARHERRRAVREAAQRRRAAGA